MMARSCCIGPMASNLSDVERQALKVLVADHSIVIRNADKGGTVIVLDSEVYKNEALRQLSNVNTYQKFKADPTSPFKKALSSLLDSAVHAGLFSLKEKELFFPECPIMPVFHHLPKVHKGLNTLLGRPIVAEIGLLNERLGEWVDSQLQPLVCSLPGFLRDTKQLLNKTQDVPWNDNYRWISCDVASLYSSIPHNLGIQTVA